MKPLLALLELLIPTLIFALSPPMSTYSVSSGVGYRLDPMGGGEEALHRGLDMVGPPSSAILAAGDGVVVEHWLPPGTPRGDGNTFTGHPVFGGMIIIDHGHGIWTLYGHLSKTFVREGMRVKRGQVIGIQGHTGQATGDHLHFEVVIDPTLLFNIPILVWGHDAAMRLLK
jgi:murein DD-endopeptidase MepM/ murein hydrolase activator NlpD